MNTVIMKTKTFKINKKQRKSKERREQKYSKIKKLKMILLKDSVPMKMKVTKSLKVHSKNNLRERTISLTNLNTVLMLTKCQSKNRRAVSVRYQIHSSLVSTRREQWRITKEHRH
jgi:hypothetical protein